MLCRPSPQVFREAHPQTGENIKMITDEVSQIQEVSLPLPQGVCLLVDARKVTRCVIVGLFAMKMVSFFWFPGEVLFKDSPRADGGQTEQ